MNALLLKQIKSWQRSIQTHFKAQQPELPPAEIGAISRQLILQILCLYLCQQRGLLADQSLQALQTGTDRLRHLQRCWQQMGDRLGVLPFIGEPLEFRRSDLLLGSLIGSLDSASVNSLGMLPVEMLGQTYEHLLANGSSTLKLRSPALAPALSRKKAQGIYYTPPAIIGYIIENTIAPLLPAAAPLHILDPSCGSGAFLLAAYRYLLSWHAPSANPAQQLRWIYGVDLDPDAVGISKLSLRLLLLEHSTDPAADVVPTLDHNIRCGNALVDQPETPQAQSNWAAFHWQTAFPEVFQAGGFDVVIGNPPYVDSEAMSLHDSQLRHYCMEHYRTATGNWDLFCVFIEKALNLCRSQGFTSLVVPNKLASANYAAAARQLLAQDNQLLAIRDYSRSAAFAAAVYPLVYVAQKKRPDPQATVRYELMQNLEQVDRTRSMAINQPGLKAGLPWPIAMPPQCSELMLRLRQEFPTLAAVAQVTGAATVAEAYALQPLIQNCSQPEADDLKLINSGTIDRYCVLWGKQPMRYLGTRYRHPILTGDRQVLLALKRQQQAKQAKIIVAGLTQRLEAALDATGAILAGKSTSVICHAQETALDLRYLLGLLNSRLLSVYVTSQFAGNQLQGGFFRIGPPQLRQLPICLLSLENRRERQHYHQLIDWVEQLLTAHQERLNATTPEQQRDWQQQCDQLDRAIDQLVYRLYHLTDAQMESCDRLSFPQSC